MSAWEEFVLWAERERPGFLSFYEEDSKEVQKSYKDWLRDHTHSNVEILKGPKVQNRKASWQCDCGSTKVHENFVALDGLVTYQYDVSEWPIKRGYDSFGCYESIGMNCADCGNRLDREEEMLVIDYLEEGPNGC